MQIKLINTILIFFFPWLIFMFVMLKHSSPQKSMYLISFLLYVPHHILYFYHKSWRNYLQNAKALQQYAT